MAITGNTTINVGLPNESTGSDSLYTAFNKINDNFDILFANASPNIVAGNGVSISVANNTATVTNTGVTGIVAGANVLVTNVGGVYTISTGDISSAGTVTSVNVVPVSSSRITSSGGPITTYGNISLDLATTGVDPGTYTSPIITVDSYGRITSASTGAGSGTVSSVGLTPGSGIQITGGPVTTSGNITVTNSGVVSLAAGPGIALSGSNGNVTITSLISLGSGVGTVTNVDISSSTLNITGGPINTSGTINIEMPNVITANRMELDSTTGITLEITQRGTSKALLISDQVDDPSPFFVGSGGYIVTGATALQTFDDSLIPRVQVAAGGAGIGILNYSSTTVPPYIVFAKARGGDIDAKTSVEAGDNLGRIYFQGYNTSEYFTGARIEASVDSPPSGTDLPTKLEFFTTPTGANSSVVRMTISNTGSTVIEATDNSNAALRVTQTGSAPALLIEDSNNPDATPFTINNGGAVSIGYTEQISVGSKLEVVDSDASIYRYGVGATGAWLNLMKSSNNTIGGHDLVNADDVVFNINGYASDGVQFAKAGDIVLQVQETPVYGSDSIPSKMLLRTTGNGNTLPTTRQVLYDDGAVGFPGILLLNGVENLADGAAVTLLETASYFTVGATGETATLAAGTAGMIKTFMMFGTSGGDMVITVDNAGWKSSGTGTMTFDTRGDGCTLQYINSKWFCIGNNGVVFA